MVCRHYRDEVDTIRPYFQSDHATLYVGDCRDVCAELPRRSVDLLVTDPPYGVRWQSGRRGEKFDPIAGDDGTLDVPEVLGEIVIRTLRPHRHVYVFGYPPDALAGPCKLGGTSELIWNKAQIGPGALDAPWGPSWERITFGVYTPSAANRKAGGGRLSARLRAESVLTFPRPNSRGVNKHPTEKPVPLMRTLVESSSLVGEVVLDPFAGSGSTLVAAVLAGRRAVGVELDERYAETAAKRLEKAEALVRDMVGI